MGSNAGDESTETSERSMEDELISFAMTLWTGSASPMALTTVIKLGVLEIIKAEGAATGGHMSPAEITAHLPTKNPAAAGMLDRMLRLLASCEVLTCKLRTTGVEGRVERTYGLAPVCVFLTKAGDGLPVALLNQDKVFMDCWYHLKDAVLDGGVPFNKTYGMNLSEYLTTDQRFSKVFTSTMTKSSLLISKKIVEKYDGFEGISTLVDIGGGMGTTLNLITSMYDSIKGINFDLPNVIENAPSYPGVEHVGGDMFVSVPKGDAIFLKNRSTLGWSEYNGKTVGDALVKCLWDGANIMLPSDLYNDERCLKLLKNCYDALPSHGKVIICDYILPVDLDSSNSIKAMLHSDMIMLTINTGGKERTKDEFEYLAKASGFKDLRIACSAYDVMVMELYKKN